MKIFDFLQKQRPKIGDTIPFGRYFFENEKDIQPIEWMVLDNQNDELLLLSNFCLDVIHYFDQTIPYDYTGTISWENSHLRDWLNDKFYNQAFTKKEKKRIVETVIVTDESLDPALHRNKLFILSQSQIEEFLPDREKRCGLPTPYARKQGAGAGIDTQEKAVWWWTTPVTGCSLSGQLYPAIVSYDGQVLYHSRLIASPGSIHATVRPAIKIKRSF